MASVHDINEVFTPQQGKGKTHRALKSGVSPKAPSSKLVAPQFSGSTELGPQVHQNHGNCTKAKYQVHSKMHQGQASDGKRYQRKIANSTSKRHFYRIMSTDSNTKIVETARINCQEQHSTCISLENRTAGRVLLPSLNDGLDTNLQWQLVNPRAIMMEYRHVAAVQSQISPKDSDLSDEKFPRLSSPSNRVSWSFTEMIHCTILPLSWTYQ